MARLHCVAFRGGSSISPQAGMYLPNLFCNLRVQSSNFKVQTFKDSFDTFKALFDTSKEVFDTFYALFGTFKALLYTFNTLLIHFFVLFRHKPHQNPNFKLSNLLNWALNLISNFELNYKINWPGLPADRMQNGTATLLRLAGPCLQLLKS